VSSAGGRTMNTEPACQKREIGWRSASTIGGAVIVAMGCGGSNVAAQTDKYPRMAPIDQYLMERDAEIQLARSAAPESISRDATILILGR
jgi:hypothetical protein